MTKKQQNRVLIQMVPASPDRLCDHDHPYKRPVAALISVTLDGRCSAWSGCMDDVRWYTDQQIVDDHGLPMAVEVR